MLRNESRDGPPGRAYTPSLIGGLTSMTDIGRRAQAYLVRKHCTSKVFVMELRQRFSPEPNKLLWMIHSQRYNHEGQGSVYFLLYLPPPLKPPQQYSHIALSEYHLLISRANQGSPQPLIKSLIRPVK